MRRGLRNTLRVAWRPSCAGTIEDLTMKKIGMVTFIIATQMAADAPLLWLLYFLHFNKFKILTAPVTAMCRACRSGLFCRVGVIFIEVTSDV